MSAGTTEPIVSFERAPVVEVICGVQFNPLPMQTAHVGLFWERVRDRYRETRDAPPLPPVMELPVGLPTSTISWSSLPDLRRVFFLDPDRGRLLQLQADRLHHNWQRRSEADVYPRFGEVFAEFLRCWGDLGAFAKSIELPTPWPSQCEVTYINHIPVGPLWNDADFSRVLPWFTPRNASVSAAPEVETALHYDVPECAGRLHVTIRTGMRAADRVRVLLVDLTVRGALQGAHDDEDMRDWFARARSVLVRSFAELTGPAAHTEWGRIQ